MISLMKNFIKAFLALSISFCVFAIPVGQNETVFSLIYSMISPEYDKAYSKMKEAVKESVQYGKNYTQNVWSNSVEKIKKRRDEVVKGNSQEDLQGQSAAIDLHSDYTPEELNLIQKVIHYSEVEDQDP